MTPGADTGPASAVSRPGAGCRHQPRSEARPGSPGRWWLGWPLTGPQPRALAALVTGDHADPGSRGDIWHHGEAIMGRLDIKQWTLITK